MAPKSEEWKKYLSSIKGGWIGKDHTEENLEKNKQAHLGKNLQKNKNDIFLSGK